MSYSIEDARDREVMQELHEALTLLSERLNACRGRGFSIQLLQEQEVNENGKAVKKLVDFRQSYDSRLEGPLAARLTKAYDLPYGGAK